MQENSSGCFFLNTVYSRYLLQYDTIEAGTRLIASCVLFYLSFIYLYPFIFIIPSIFTLYEVLWDAEQCRNSA